MLHHQPWLVYHCLHGMQIAYIMLVNSKGQTFYLDQHQLQAAQFPSEFAVHNAKQGGALLSFLLSFVVMSPLLDHQVPRLCNIAWAEPTWPYTGTPGTCLQQEHQGGCLSFSPDSDVAATWEPPKVLLHLFVDGLSVHSICMPMAPTLLYLEQGSGLANRSDDYLLASYLVLQSLEAPSPQLVSSRSVLIDWLFHHTSSAFAAPFLRVNCSPCVVLLHR